MQSETTHLEGAGFRRAAFFLSTRKTELLILSFLFLVTLITHLLTCARTVTFSDSGDFLMGILTIGNIHGPGYPLYLMTARLFCWIFPFGSLPFRVSAYSSIFAALTACLLYGVVFRLSRNRAGAFVGALAFTFSYTFWYQTVIPETYSLNTFFILLLILLAMRWERQLLRSERRRAENTLCLFAFCFGLALSNHITVLFTLPAFIYLFADTAFRDAFAPRNLIRAAVFLGLGLLPYLYIPVAAFRGPAYNYGDPATLTGWIRHVTAYYQREGLFSYPFRFFPARFWRYFGTLTTEFPYFFWLAPVGLAGSFLKEKKKYPLFLVFLFLLLLLPVMTYKQLEAVLRAHFYYTAYLVVAIWIGLGVSLVIKLTIRWASRRDRLVRSTAVAVLSILALTGPVLAAGIHWDKVDKSDYYYAEDMAVNMLETADPGSIVIVGSDNTFFPCTYMQVAHGLRPDVRIISDSAAGLPGFQGGDLLSWVPPGYEQESDVKYLQLVERNYRRLPVYGSTPNFVNYNWKQFGVGYLIRIFPPDWDVAPPTEGPTFIRGAADGSFKDSDAREALMLPEALESSVLFGKKDLEGASEIYEEITGRFVKDIYVPTLYSCGTFSGLFNLWSQALGMQREYRETVDNMQPAYTIDPDFYSTALALAYQQLGELDLAVSELKKVIAFQPDSTQALRQLGEIYTQLDLPADAVSTLREAVDSDPKDPLSRLLLGRALMGAGREGEAVEQFELVLELEPDQAIADSARETLDMLLGPTY